MLYKLKLGEANIFMIGRTNENPPWRHNGRTMTYNHLVLIISGSCKCKIENREYNVEAGHLLFIPADKYYRLTTSNHCEYCFACFLCGYQSANENERAFCQRRLPEKELKFYLPSAESDTICLQEYIKLDAASYSNLLTLFTQCQKFYASGYYLERLMINACFAEMLIFASRSACGINEFNEKISLSLDRMLKYIDQNFTEQITPDSLAAHFSLSKEHICSLFKKELNLTVSEYVNAVKLNHAIELLSNSSMNVSQISEYLGYSSIYYFSRLFKQHYGISPTGYIYKT